MILFQSQSGGPDPLLGGEGSKCCRIVREYTITIVHVACTQNIIHIRYPDDVRTPALMHLVMFRVGSLKSKYINILI